MKKVTTGPVLTGEEDERISHTVSVVVSTTPAPALLCCETFDFA